MFGGEATLNYLDTVDGIERDLDDMLRRYADSGGTALSPTSVRGSTRRLTQTGTSSSTRMTD
ncbi:hypothetical protein CIW49_13650 [Mycolicibacterium sp. P1-18]|nr:hypothetical protein CIW49_13650 [Mycolicibacterium sp. P1-18]